MPPEPGFFDKINRLTALLAQDNESPTVLGEMQELLRDQDVRREFFNTLQNPKWIGPLLREGYFDDPPAIKRVEGGASSILLGRNRGIWREWLRTLLRKWPPSSRKPKLAIRR